VLLVHRAAEAVKATMVYPRLLPLVHDLVLNRVLLSGPPETDGLEGVVAVGLDWVHLPLLQQQPTAVRWQ